MVDTELLEQAGEADTRHTTVRQQITDALATLTTGGTGDQNPGQPLNPVKVYQGGTGELHRLLNHAFFHRLELADNRISKHEP